MKPGRGRYRLRGLTAVLIAAACAFRATPGHAQSIEPRAYSDIPVGMNFLTAGYAYSQGGLEYETLPVSNAHFDTSTGILGFTHSLDAWGKSANFSAVLPFSWLSGSALYAGQPLSREISAFGDPALRFAINLLGAPALGAREFASYRQDLIVGVSLLVIPPLGQYDSSKIVNLGTNRWTFKPEVGLSKALGPWIIELQAAVTFYTDNTDFYGGNTRTQEPLYLLQEHVIYQFGRGAWASADAIYYTGGRTALNGALHNDLQQNWRLGATLAMPLSRRDSLKLYASDGVSTRTGNNFRLVGLAWVHRWGGPN
jgi:hypothetical protein